MLRVTYGTLFLLLANLLVGCEGPAAQENARVPTTPASTPTAPAAEQNSASLNGVAVIDLDEVAARLGRDVEIVNEVKNREAQLNQELEALRASYAKQIEEKKSQLGIRPTTEQEQEVQALDQDLGAKLQQAQLDAQRELIRHQNSLVTRLRERVKPVARDVAASRGLLMVVAKNEDVVFTFDNSLDITSDVVERLLSQPSTGSTYNAPVSPPATTYNRPETTFDPSSPQPPAPRTAKQFQPAPGSQQR